jgi:HEAT repeat protein
MLPAAARFAGALALLALALNSSRADDPVYEGKAASKWIDAAQNGSSARQRALAVDALGKIWVAHKNKDALTNIGRALRVDPSAAVRAQAAVVLAGLRAEDAKNLPLFAKDLVAALGTEKESRVRKEVLAAVAKFPDVCALGVEQLTGALKDPDPAVKVAAAECIATAGATLKDGAPAAAPGLVPLLKDENKSVRAAAVFALGRIRPEGASTLSDAMAKMLGAEKEADLKRELVTSLGLLGEKSGPVVQALSGALSDPDEEVRRRAARVLGTFGSAAAPAADALFKVVTSDKAADVRVDAVRALGSALGPAGVKARLKDFRAQLDPSAQPSFEVRLALVEEIGALGWEHLGADLNSPDGAAKAAARDTIAALRRRLADPQINVRDAAAKAIRGIEKKPEPKKEPEKK